MPLSVDPNQAILGLKRRLGPTAADRSPVVHLDLWVEYKGVQQTSAIWTDWAEPIGLLSAHRHFRPTNSPLIESR
jgi:hypothetical protein